MIETIVVAFVVAAAAAYTGRLLYRSVSGRKSPACDCKRDCAVKEGCPTAQIDRAARRDTEI